MRKERWIWAGLVVIAFSIGYWIHGAQWGKGVKEVPSIVGALNHLKVTTESEAVRIRRKLPSSEDLAKRDLEKGEELYGQLKASLDDYIGFLRVVVALRFANETDMNTVAEKATAINTHSAAFWAWIASHSQTKAANTTGGATPQLLAEAAKVLPDFLKLSSEADEQLISRIREDLEKCRLRTWDELGPNK